jgi:hypothetical protein
MLVLENGAQECESKRFGTMMINHVVRLLFPVKLNPHMCILDGGIGNGLFTVVFLEMTAMLAALETLPSSSTSFRVKTCSLASLAALTRLQTAPFYSRIQCFQRTSTPYPVVSASPEAPIATDAVFHPNKWFSLLASQSFYPYRRN